MITLDTYKQQAAEQALGYVESGMVIGLGTGTTARHLVNGLAARLRDGRLRDVVGVPTSDATASQARALGIAIATLDQHPQLDLAIDGADEIDPALNLIKGLGGALLREKIVAASAERFVVIADDSKLVERLGTRAPLPIEVIAFGRPLVERRLLGLGCTPALRLAADGSPFRTDEGNLILDCRFAEMRDPDALSAAIHAIPGVVGHGLFIGMAAIVVVVGARGLATMVRASE
jgi:ribose 5-phosphate isomerase A